MLIVGCSNGVKGEDDKITIENEESKIVVERLISETTNYELLNEINDVSTETVPTNTS